ncbi:MAG: hypothetical protein BMS9Abin02_1863 [Anaerolineae bacterium]|nr:MAG: hypothetical protein BMS9Abin02_1863 [Anaerolineae bacterium]
MDTKSLSGESDIRSFSVRSDVGAHADPNQAIAPVVAQDLEGGQFRFVGTAFFIMVNGLIVTAKHILDDVREDGKVVGPIGIIHFIGKNTFYIRNIKKSYEYPNSDVTLALLDQPRHKVTGEPLLNKVLTLNLYEANTGDRVFTYAYPKTSVDIKEKQHVFRIVPSIYEGTLVTEFPEGRDSTMLPNPCWKTDMHIHGGASGGPVFNENGHVIGINSTSFPVDPSCSFISTLNHIQNLRVQEVSVPDKKLSNPTVRELIDAGLISTADNKSFEKDKC